MTDQTPRTLRLTGEQLASIEPPIGPEWVTDWDEYVDFIEAEAAQPANANAVVLYRAMCSLDSDDPGVFNIVAISEPDTRPVAERLAAEYDRLAALEDSDD